MFTTDFHEIPLEAFRELPSEILTEAFFWANELTGAYVAVRAGGVLREMGAEPAEAPPSPGQAMERLGLRPDRAGVWEWLLRMLADSRDVGRILSRLAGRGGAAEPGGLIHPPRPPLRGGDTSIPGLRARILEDDPRLVPVLDLIDAAASGYPDFLRGRRDGSSILFDPARPALWDRYFDNANPLYAPGNTLAAHEALLAVSARGRESGLRVLEVGAGGGSAAEALLRSAGSRIERYLLTDISPGFLRRARERLERHAGAAGAGLDFRPLDLNRAPADWRVERGAHDLVFAVNVLHSVRDLIRVLAGLRGLLAPGGVLVLGECVRPARGKPLHHEFVFQLLDEFRGALLDLGCRPEPGFLDAASWRSALARAGFRPARIVPDFEAAVAAYPEYSLAAIVAESRDEEGGA